MALIKFNTNQTCIEFFNEIKNDPAILRAIKGGQKYKESATRMHSRVLQLNQEIDNSRDAKQPEC